ncbi:MAG: immunoglobulin domain-containing protein, partial [Bacteroidetes bacterium]|nr:immunoglobulin domain-containing protein [Bacteroidota bacterium]
MTRFFTRLLLSMALWLVVSPNRSLAQISFFTENWSSNSFGTWTFPSGQGNWLMGAAYTPLGATAPNAYFSWSPSLNNYSYELVSPVINATAYTAVTLDYKLQLNNFTTSTLEQLAVEYKPTSSSTWTLITNYTNTAGSFDVAPTNIFIPLANTQNFQIRFRAYGVYSYNINGWGVDDINVKGAFATPCSGKPTAGVVTPTGTCPTVLNLVGTTMQANINMQWQSKLSCGGTWTNIPGATTWAYTLPTFSQPTQFRAISVCTNSNQSDTSAPVTINSVSPCYCTSTATYVADEDIFNVTLGTLNNTSNCTSIGPGPGSVNSLYSNYTTLTPPDLLKGTTYPFSVTVGYCGTYAYSNVAAIYIDFNQNGVYTDPGENVYTSTSGAGSVAGGRVLTGSFTVPSNAVSGKTGMRVVAVEGTTVSPCGTYGYGETEDYLVNILYSPNVTGTGLVNYQGTYCAGLNVTLTASAPGYTNPSFVWKKPNGTWDTSTVLTINNIQPSQGGNYFLYMLTSGCSGNPPDTSAPRLVQLTVNPIPPMPTGASIITYCQNDPFDSIHVVGLNLKWYTVPNGGVAGPSPVINTSIGGTYTFYVSQTIDGCESPRKQITVTVSPKPPMPTA